MIDQDRPLAANRDSSAVDLGPLSWVVGSLRETFDGVSAQLVEFGCKAEAASGSHLTALDTTPLRFAAQGLHEAVGVLDLIERPAVAQVVGAMERAGWVKADPITAQSSWAMVASTLQRRSYPEAPVSPLFLFGKQQAFAYQQEVDGNPKQRHHVRFWPCPEGWLLPGGARVDWLAAGTFDTSVGLSFFTLQVTHRIDANTDIERDYIVDTVSEANSAVRIRVLENFSTGYHARNGGGDSIRTDGNLPVIDVRGLA